MIQVILLGFLGLILLVFCVIDLWHLKEMLKTLKQIQYFMALYNIKDKSEE